MGVSCLLRSSGAASNALSAARKALLSMLRSPGQEMGAWSIETERDLVRRSQLELAVVACCDGLGRLVVM